MLIYLIIAILIAVGVGLSRSRKQIMAVSSLFYIAQIIFTTWIITSQMGNSDTWFFTFDSLGAIFAALITIISTISFYLSNIYLDRETTHQYKIYNISLMLLCAFAMALFFADNLAVTWIFLEATTLSTAGLVYHRRTARSLEATWKYIFVCSTGIAIAYLGILLLSTMSISGDMSYVGLAQNVANGNQLYLKIAFLFIFVGYSCKLEVFPLYTSGVDATFAMPTPASAMISTILTGAGFVALFRVYKVIALSPIADWMGSILIIAGVISILIGAVYMRRTNNFKRFLSYSSVENMGIAIVGLGVGGLGLFAALFHVVGHSLIKSSMFFNIAQVGKSYGTYRINRIGNYMNISKLSSASILFGALSLLAFPPSALFISELLIFKQIIASERWWLLVMMVFLLCFVMYSLMNRIMQLFYKSVDIEKVKRQKINRFVIWLSFVLLLLSVTLGVIQTPQLIDFLNSIVS